MLLKSKTKRKRFALIITKLDDSHFGINHSDIELLYYFLENGVWNGKLWVSTLTCKQAGKNQKLLIIKRSIVKFVQWNLSKLSTRTQSLETLYDKLHCWPNYQLNVAYTVRTYFNVILKTIFFYYYCKYKARISKAFLPYWTKHYYIACFCTLASLYAFCGLFYLFLLLQTSNILINLKKKADFYRMIYSVDQ